MRKSGIYNRLIIIIKIMMILGSILIISAFVDFSEEQNHKIVSMIKPRPVIAEIINTTPVYKSCSKTSGRVGVLYRGVKVEILQDRSEKWYRVKESDTKNSGWVERDSLLIPADEPPCRDLMSKEQLETYMNFMGYESKTDYFVLTEIYRQSTHVFKGSKNNWTLEKSMICSTGKNTSPTTRGSFTITDRGEWFYSERLKSGSMYWVRFNGAYLFHSIAMNKNREVLDGVIGDQRSMGCIRLLLDDARWFYTKVPDGTSVLVI